MTTLDLEQRAAIGGGMVLPALQGLKNEANNRLPLNISDDDLIFATVWAAVQHSVQTTGGTSAIERLRDILDQIETCGAFGLR